MLSIFTGLIRNWWSTGKNNLFRDCLIWFGLLNNLLENYNWILKPLCSKCMTALIWNPLNYKLPFCLWSLNNIRALLQKERAVILSKSSICRLLGHLGLTPQKPLYKSYKKDPDKIKTYLSETYPEAVAQAKKYHARIYFLDEAAFRTDAHLGTTWGEVWGNTSS